jgi:5'-nucleotidase
MRQVLTVALAALLTLLVVGCRNKPQGPKTTSLEPPRRTLEDLEPMQEVQAEPMSDVRIDPAPTPRPVTQTPSYSAAPAPSIEPVAPPQPSVQTHTLRKGDTLWSLAQRYLNNGHRWREILQANPGLKANELPVGKTIQIPAR